ncbi:RHS repeat-associated core domain-containing protein [Streptomyces sp. NPDC059752]|uniref:RHS repeat-associated core domain-containing protein n=1 Tax=unclassified Streptomyces TaxID=2593676 RepID=UPI00365413EC
MSYSDGFGREIQHKGRAEDGPLDDGGPDVSGRWVTSGWTVFDNKGQPVRQYEPFFSAAPAFEFARTKGVSPVLCRDPLGRVVATLHPDHTWEKVVFDPWRHVTHDVSDTIAVDDPSTDPDVGGFFRRLRPDEYLPSWRTTRLQGPPGLEREAAEQSEVFADTPTTAFADSLGRPFLTIATNRFARGGATITEQHPTQVAHDIEGNQREIRDALGRVVMRYDYDLLGHRIHQASMEAGERWTLNDAAGHPVHTWNSLRNDVRITYDDLRRLTGEWLRLSGATTEVLVSRTTYGDDPEHPGGRPAAETSNLLGRVHQLFDGAGVISHDLYDFAGNLTRSERRLAQEYRQAPDWAQPPRLEELVYATESRFDALSRPITVTTPDGTVLAPTYNDAGLLETVTGNVGGAPTSTTFVTGIGYDAKGRRTDIDYGNGVRTEYRYDPHTFRLASLHSRRGERFPDDCPPPGQVPCGVQYLSYTYDAAGNITHIRDAAQQTVFFRNQRVEPSARYTYDAVFRLIEAAGREHVGRTAGTRSAPTPADWTDAPRTGIPHPGDGNAMGTYRQRYTYDTAGNIQEMQHVATDPASHTPTNTGWTRTYSYTEPSQLNPQEHSNRLSSTRTGRDVESFTHDAHGNMTAMPHLTVMRSDHRDQLAATATQRVTSGTPEITYYVYDSAGQRVRKVTEGPAAAGATPVRRKERLYLGDVEIYREYGPDGTTVTLERETLHVMDDKARVALVETRTIGTDPAPVQLTRYQLGNHLGSASVELDDQARIISYEEYHPYGSTSYQTVQSALETPKRYRYTGQERDEETGLQYHGARYYAPWLGTWSSADPSGVESGLNLYQYVESRPTVHTDPTGEWALALAGILVAGLIVVMTAESEAGAPTNVEDIRRLKPAVTDTEFLAHATVSALAAGSGGAAANAAMKSAPTILKGALGSTVAGSTQAVGDRAIADVKRGDLSSGGTYFNEAVSGGAGAAVVHTAGAGAGALVASEARAVAGVGRPPANPYNTKANSTYYKNNPAAKRSLSAAADPTSASPEDPTAVRPDVHVRSVLREDVNGPALESKSRGYDRRSKKYQKMLEPKRWDPDKLKPADLELDHRVTPHAMLKPTAPGQVGAVPKSWNNQQSHLEKKEVAQRRQLSEKLGLPLHDPVANPRLFTRPPRR